MIRNSRQIPALVLLSILTLAAVAPAQPDSDNAVSDVSRSDVPVIAVLPFVDYTGTDQARAIFGPLIETRLKKETVSVLTPETIRETLRENRIRAGGEINSVDARRLAEQTGAGYLLLGSYDFFADETIPEAGLSLRLLDPGRMRILWAVSEAACGDDLEGLFGIGRATDINQLAEKVVDRAFRDFDLAPSADTRSTPFAFAVIPFDNMANRQNAGHIVTHYFLSAMIARGWAVIEPGMVSNAALSLGKAPRGEIDRTMLDYLRDSLHVDMVITGTVDEFQPGRTDAAPPSIALDARLICAGDGKIIGALVDARDGGDVGALIKNGPGQSLGRLTGEAVEKILKRFDAALNEYAAQNHE